MIGRISMVLSDTHSIERALLEDADSISALYKKVRSQLSKEEKLFVYEPSKGTLNRIFHGNGTVLIARKDEEENILGAAIIEYPRTEKDNMGLSRKLKSDFEKCSVLRSIVVSPSSRREGIAGALVLEWIRGSSRNNRPYCITEVVKGNNPSMRVFQSMGFRSVKKAVHPYDSAKTVLFSLNALAPSDGVPNIFK